MWGAEQLQAAAVLFYLTVFLLAGPLTLTGLICLLLRPATAWIPLCYAVWWLWDLQVPPVLYTVLNLTMQVCNRGGRRGRAVHWVRGWKLWQLFRDYFPVKLVSTATALYCVLCTVLYCIDRSGPPHFPPAVTI